ncbi:MAG: DUF1800 domain-containing protein, partial [Chloroflexi bacterium]|nr:DUF1800 domain-containing protein [Chloroflexota bacterium]
KMTLFWHGHFATAVQKVGNTRWMYQQNQIFRQNALGRFDDLLSAVYKDPAMLRWLDGERNTKLAPNENWGREVMELFTVGIGNYTEDDVHASSRSFTGWRIDLNTNQGLFIDRLHDGGVKTLLGQTGNWDGEDAVRILAAHPATGTFLATRLWRFFASDQPPAGAIQTISDVYYTADHSIREMVRTLFSLPEFYSARVKSGHIKSPVEFVVGSIKQLGLSVTALDLKLLPRVLAGLGQELFNPPNVGGWPGGPTWINAATMLGRFNFASYLTGDQVRTKTPLIDTTAVLAASGAEMSDAFSATTRVETISTLASFVTDTLGIAPTVSTHRALIGYASEGSLALDALDTAIRGMIHLTLVSPEYQAS